MTEAFEIGVSLALQDGVSDAIGKARRDVAALEHAVRESGVSLRSLREVGARSASVAFGDQRKEVAAGAARLVAREAAPFADRDKAPRAETEATPRPLAATRLSLAPAALGEVASPPAMGARQFELLARPTQEAGPGAPARLEGSFSEAPLALASKAPPAPLEGMGRVAAPVGDALVDDAGGGAAALSTGGAGPIAAAPIFFEDQPQTQLGAAQGPAQPAAPANWETKVARHAPRSEEPAPLSRGDEPGSSGSMTLLRALRLSGGSHPITQSEDPSTAIVNNAPAFDDGAVTGHAQPAAISVAMTPGGAPPSGVTAPSARAQNTAQQPDSRDARPHEGDVFLDGMLVGRWMSKFLNREAERASAGPTGFDARRGRLLPGVTVGG